MTAPHPSRRAAIADWFGLNRATLALLAVIGFLGLSEELWSNFLSLHLKEQAEASEATNASLHGRHLHGPDCQWQEPH